MPVEDVKCCMMAIESCQVVTAKTCMPGILPRAQAGWMAASWRDGLGALEKGPLECGLSKPIMGFQSPSWAFFFFQKMAPIFLEALSLWVRCRRRFFFPEKWPPSFLGSPKLVGTLPQAPFFSEKIDEKKTRP